MQSLLRWSIENSSGDGEGAPQQQPPQEPRKGLDPGIIDMILGKPDSELMKESLAIALDEKREEDERLQALDNFEMVRIYICSSMNNLNLRPFQLIEHIDNANSS